MAKSIIHETMIFRGKTQSRELAMIAVRECNRGITETEAVRAWKNGLRSATATAGRKVARKAGEGIHGKAKGQSEGAPARARPLYLGCTVQISFNSLQVMSRPCQRCTLFHYSESSSPLCLLALPKVYILPLLRVSFSLMPFGFAKGRPGAARLGQQGCVLSVNSSIVIGVSAAATRSVIHHRQRQRQALPSTINYPHQQRAFPPSTPMNNSAEYRGLTHRGTWPWKLRPTIQGTQRPCSQPFMSPVDNHHVAIAHPR
ncbi:uncharacterized protein LACBIDRAFT_334460 [Laccaria bicolor S238N-H82]|uniref:Predicted protein n=1 Tax=Laccaria bicolor (strain S238N-H82 / ATCC MYA-4686) TaxID=486041 RepID=B0DZ99_LACBS|nr:uncharacterized protein LACBIDRAFT_334460 [Laccaria bicolor S238N-H82]EDR00052.1 predicted protein [Laccaria bicolor S238N-H82]|eukprot:XP_001889258.1 predicted protein [Laccaria bicolor S238N-H82]